MSAQARNSEAVAMRLLRGVVGGVGAGLLFIWVTMWFASENGEPAETPLRMISTIAKGDGAMMDGTASVGVGWMVHLVLSAAFGLVFALFTPMMKTNGTVLLAGTMYGGLLYVVNFLILAPIAFETFEMPNQAFELVVHVAFGTLMAGTFLSSGPRRSESVCAMDMPARRTAGV